MIIFIWLLYINPIQSEQLLRVFLSAFIVQGREKPEQLSDYFNKKILPRLEKDHLIQIAYHEDKIVGFIIFEKLAKKVITLPKWLFYQNTNTKALGTTGLFYF